MLGYQVWGEKKRPGSLAHQFWDRERAAERFWKRGGTGENCEIDWWDPCPLASLAMSRKGLQPLAAHARQKSLPYWELRGRERGLHSIRKNYFLPGTFESGLKIYKTELLRKIEIKNLGPGASLSYSLYCSDDSSFKTVALPTQIGHLPLACAYPDPFFPYAPNS